MSKIEEKTKYLSDIEICNSIKPVHIEKVVEKLEIPKEHYDLYGKYVAKVHLSILNGYKKGKDDDNKDGKMILVAGINPTPLGEGKSTSCLGLVDSLGSVLKKKVFCCIRQPSQGPTFSIKGGGSGGGYSQVNPMEIANGSLTGDIHAVSAATNLLAAQLDTRILHENTQSNKSLFKRIFPKRNGKRLPFNKMWKIRLNKLGIKAEKPEDLTEEEKGRLLRLDIDIDTITWKRVVDINDRLMRNITIGHGEKNFKPRKTGMDIAVASECMAILGLTSGLKDLRDRLGRIVVAQNKKGEAITADDLGCGGAMTVLMKDTVSPNLMQTLERNPVFIHAGPFANIATGNSSIIADRIALKLVGKDGYVVTEAGFGADIGAEKFFNIKCRASGIKPNCVVLVATVRALKMHGNGPVVKPGSPLAKEYVEENLGLLEKGVCNMQFHIKNLSKYGVPVVVCVNKFTSDTEKEIALVKKAAKDAGAFACEMSDHWAQGGKGAEDLAKAVVKACEEKSDFKFLYDEKDSIKDKIAAIAKSYGAKGVSYTEKAEAQIKKYTELGYDKIPICMAKTHLSNSHMPDKQGVVKDFILPIVDIKASLGAGFLFSLCGDIRTMPGLPTKPGLFDVDIDFETGNVVGLF